MRPNTQKLVTDASNATANLAKVDTAQVYAISLIAVFSDNATTGTLKLQGSNDVCAYGNMAQDFVPTNWADIANASVSVTAGGTVIIPKTDVCYRFVRPVWTRTAGAGTFSVWTTTQGF